MIVHTEAIVLNHIKFQERSIIVRLYTRDLGFRACMVNGIRGSKTRHQMAYFQPFTHLDVVLYLKESRGIQRISEFKSLHSIDYRDIEKQTLLLFLSEVVQKLLKNEHEPNPSLFSFLQASIRWLSDHETYQNFHIQLLIKLTNYIGLSILEASELFERTGLQEDVETARVVGLLIEGDYGSPINTSGKIRSQILELLVLYFRHHVDGFGSIQSLKIMQQIFH